MKACFKCQVEKPLSEFYRHPQMHDGHLGKCKECTKADTRAHYAANLDRLRHYHRTYALRPHAKARIARVSKEWARRYPERRRAQHAVNNAVRDGRLLKPIKCQVCGEQKRLHGHHHDYSKPLDVIWACRPCHSQLDVERRKRECAT